MWCGESNPVPHMWGEYSTTEPWPQPLFFIFNIVLYIIDLRPINSQLVKYKVLSLVGESVRIEDCCYCVVGCFVLSIEFSIIIRMLRVSLLYFWVKRFFSFWCLGQLCLFAVNEYDECQILRDLYKVLNLASSNRIKLYRELMWNPALKSQITNSKYRMRKVYDQYTQEGKGRCIVIIQKIQGCMNSLVSS